MDFSEYISAAYKYKFKEIGLTDNDYEFLFFDLLEWELEYGPFSIYKIYSKLKKSGHSTAYKNIHQKVQKIFSLGLIEEVKGKYLHGAKFYKISPNGWVNLILRGAFIHAPVCKPAIRKYYNTNIIFKTFIYPYFKLQTLIYFSDYEIQAYLTGCIETTLISRYALDPDAEDIKFRRVREIIIEKVGDKAITVIDTKEVMASRLDLRIKSFIFEEIITNNDRRKALALSNDEKFMDAVEDLKEEFSSGFKKLMK
jgi:hypothetical protein